MGRNGKLEKRIFILAEMLKGRKLIVVDSVELGPDNRARKRQTYYVGGIKANSRAAKNVIKTDLVEKIEDNKYKITHKGKEFYSKRGR